MNNGAFGENFPYTNFHELNLDWILSVIKKFFNEYPDMIEELNKKLNKPLLNPDGNLNQLLISLGDGTTAWADMDEAFAPEIINAVNEWLEEHPEATTTVEDGSITMAKLNDNLKFHVKKNIVPTLDFSPHFSYRHTSELYMYQSACEFDYEEDTYLALGYFLDSSTTSGIMLFKNGTLIKNRYGNDFGHLNSITYCPIDNKLYVGSSSSGPLDHIAFKCDALTLENKEDLDFRSGVLQWYDGYFYTWQPPYVSRRGYNDTQWEQVYTIDTEDKIVQTFIIYNNYCYFNLLDNSEVQSGNMYIKVYSPENECINRIVENICYEPEQMYVYNGNMYMLVNEQDIDSTDYSVYARATVMQLNMTMNKQNIVREITRNIIYYDNENGYGTGISENKTSSPLACLLSGKTSINIGTSDFLPRQVNFTRSIQFIGDHTTKPKVSFIGIRTCNVRFSNITIGCYDTQNGIIETSLATFNECVFDLKNMVENNLYIQMRESNIIMYAPIFRANFASDTRVKSFIHSGSSTVGNVLIVPENNMFDLKNATIQNGFGSNELMFSSYVRLVIHLGAGLNQNILQGISNVTMHPIIDPMHYESGTYDLNKLTAPIQFSFASGVTLQNAPTGLSGRKIMKTEVFGTTNARVQYISDANGNIYMRTITGTNTMSFDSTGAITDSYNPGEWIQLH